MNELRALIEGLWKRGSADDDSTPTDDTASTSPGDAGASDGKEDTSASWEREREERARREEERQTRGSELLLILPLITSSIQSVTFPMSKLVALMIMRDMAMWLDDRTLLRRVVPYVKAMTEVNEIPLVRTNVSDGEVMGR